MDDGAPLIVFADDWGRHPSSCQHLVRRLIGSRPILWVNTIGTRRLRPDLYTLRRAWEKLRNWSDGVRKDDAAFQVIDLPMSPSNGPLGRAFNSHVASSILARAVRRHDLGRPIVLTTLPHVLPLIRDVRRRGLIYYCTDDYSNWPSANREAMLLAENALAGEADLVLCVSQRLFERHGPAKKTVLFPHAVDFTHFAAAADDGEVPERLLRIGKPRVGFFGLIYEKLNFELLRAVATGVPDLNLVMIGPVVSCPDDFAGLQNVHLVGPQPYGDLPSFLRGLDVLLLPYVLDEMIVQSSPLKLRECLASGKPTVSVDVPEVRRFEPHVRVAATTEDFISAVVSAVATTDSKQVVASRQGSVRNETWEARAAELVAHFRRFEPASSAVLAG